MKTKTYFVSWIITEPNITIGNSVIEIESWVSGAELAKEIVDEIKTLTPNAVVLNIVEV